jgi:hypothetical protein
MADSFKIPLTQSQLSDLVEFFAVGSEALAQGLLSLKEKWDLAMSPQDLSEGLTSIDGLKRPDAIVRLLIGLRLAGIQSNSDPHQIAKAVFDGIEADRVPENLALEWGKMATMLESYLSDPGIRRVSMIVNLSYEYSNLLRSARIISDIRPVYNENTTGIEACVVSYTLRLKYSSSEGECNTSIALDHADVVTLADQCSRAIKKADIAQSSMKDRHIPTVVSGKYQDVED